MKRFVFVLASVLAGAAPASAWAQTAPAASCAFNSSTGLLPQSGGDVTIGCTGVSEATGRQLAEILNRIVQNRLDPQQVISKLGEIVAVPEEGVARVVSDEQRQRIIKTLLGKPTGHVAVYAHPLVADSAEFAQGLASALVAVGWQIENDQIRRRAPKSLEQVAGVALVVRDRAAPPPKTQQLRAALIAANIGAELVSDASLAPDSMILWVGRRPEFEPPK